MAIQFRPAQRSIAASLAGLLLALGATGCVARREFHCTSDAACVTENGSRGICEASGICNFGGPSGAAGSSGNAADPNAMNSDAGTGGTTRASGGSGSSSGGTADLHSAGASGVEISDTAGAAGSACSDSANGNCYACKPSTSEQFLNACTSAACVPFDDQARLTKLLPGGDLPPLPVAPAP